MIYGTDYRSWIGLLVYMYIIAYLETFKMILIQ